MNGRNMDVATATAGAAATVGVAMRAGEHCGAVFFRHLRKTGGTSVRMLFRLRSNYTTIPAAEFVTGEWAERLTHNATFAEAHPRIFVEFHSPFWSDGRYFLDLLPKLPQLRAAFARRHCDVLAFTVLREPVAQILSDYLAFYDARHNHSVASILEWSRQNADVQVKHLTMRPALPDAESRRAAQDVLNSLDIVGVTEHLDELLETLCACCSMRTCGMYHAAAPPLHKAALSLVDEVAQSESLRAQLARSARVTAQLYSAWRAKWEQLGNRLCNST